MFIRCRIEAPWRSHFSPVKLAAPISPVYVPQATAAGKQCTGQSTAAAAAAPHCTSQTRTKPNASVTSDEINICVVFPPENGAQKQHYTPDKQKNRTRGPRIEGARLLQRSGDGGGALDAEIAGSCKNAVTRAPQSVCACCLLRRRARAGSADTYFSIIQFLVLLNLHLLLSNTAREDGVVFDDGDTTVTMGETVRERDFRVQGRRR